MQIVKTKNHLIYSANAGKPSHACLGSCRKVWWPDDLPDASGVLAKLTCPQCGGTLDSDIPEGHYVVVSTEVAPLEKAGMKISNAGLNLKQRMGVQHSSIASLVNNKVGALS
jgi:hypothetical protein